jgi:hypothetical protein
VFSRNTILVVLLLELVYPFYHNHPTIPRKNVYVETRLTERLQEFPKPARFSFQTGGLLAGLMTYYKLEGLHGYDGLFPERSFKRLRFYKSPEIWEKMEPFCAVRWYLSPQGVSDKSGRIHGVPDTRYIDTLDGFDIHENLRAKPRAYLVPQYTFVASEPLAILGALADPEYEPALAVVTDAPPNVPSPQPDETPLGTATVVKRVPDEVIVKAHVEQACVLVLADNFYPGWRAEIDSQPVEMFPAYTAFRGIVIPAGEHEVRFHYFPLSFRFGMAVSVNSLALGLVFVSGVLFYKRRVRSTWRVRE